MDESNKWSTPSNEAVTVVLEHPRDASMSTHFHPAFTYPIFGDEEMIFGYEDLDIKIWFKADTLTPNVRVDFSTQFEAVGDTKPDQIEEKLAPFLPTFYDDSFKPKDEPVFDSPPGELKSEYTVDGRKFGIWAASLTDPRAKQLVRNAQILIPMFIEGGMCIELDDPDWTIDRWTIFFLYAIDEVQGAPSYNFAGYSTAYRLWFQDTDSLASYDMLPSDASSKDVASLAWPSPPDHLISDKLPSRQRISQFLITPPYQTSGHGSRLYTTMMDVFLTNPRVKEITVEDPNESFDMLRDTNDLLRLRHDPLWTTQHLNADAKMPPSRSSPLPHASILDPALQDQIKRAMRLAARQLGRLTEMQLLSTIPARNRALTRITRKDKASDRWDRAYFLWRLLVKQRLSRHNADALRQLEPDERVDRLDDTIAGVEREYLDILERVERRVEAAGSANGGGGGAAAKKRKLASRARGDADGPGENATAAHEDGDGLATAGAASAAARAKKRTRIADEDDEDE